MRAYVCVLIVLLVTPNMKGQSINTKKVAIEGYDVVAYHKGKALQGTNRLSAQIDDVYYHFSNEENKNLFEKDPEKYLPKYGGFCAIGIAKYNGKYDIDPEDFLIDDGELYLFCPNVIDKWIADKENLKKKADSKWPGIKEKPKKKRK